ncbi:bcl-2-binding component 3 isoform X2 [Sagmatias obliquidens]|uniref:bcl-2-binding component 3 isoform X2 n=1 Tax=Sagmatias obliquidens TaxID=3371155 RepID=UPI000F43ED43|nr:bcl-2-binding component 3 isoform X2 [Lagenorhynchus obliquidens]
MCECSVSVCVCASTPLSRVCAFVCLQVGLSPRPCQHVTLCTLERQTVSLRTRLWVCVSVGPSQCVSVCVRLSRCLSGRSARLRAPGQALPRPRLQGNPPRRGWGRGARQQVPTCPRLAGGAVASRGGGAWDPPGGGGAGRGCRRAGPGSAGRPETRREPHASGCLVAAAAAAKPAAAAARTRTRLRPEEKPRQQQQRQQRQPLQLEQQQQQQQQQQQPQQQPQRAALGGRALLKEAARPPSPSPPACSCPRETRGAAATPPLPLEGPVQSHHGTPALTQGPRSPRDGAQLGACTRPVDVGDVGGRTLPPPDALASAGDFFCTM